MGTRMTQPRPQGLLSDEFSKWRLRSAILKTEKTLGARLRMTRFNALEIQPYW